MSIDSTPRSRSSQSRPWIDKSIASNDNGVFRTLVDCLSTKGIKKHGLFILSGEKAVNDILDQYPERTRGLLFCTELHLDVNERDPRPKIPAFGALIEKFRHQHEKDTTSSVRPSPGPLPRPSPGPSVTAFAKPLFDQLDLFGTHSPLLVVSSWEIPPLDLTVPPEGLELVCALSDPANLGALLRSAAAFNASKVILLRESASPFHPKAGRSASAATFTTPLFRGPSISALSEQAKIAKANGTPIIALDMDGTRLNEYRWPKNTRLLLGEEGRGVPDQNEGFEAITIPISSGIESLNATVAASIALYSYRSQFPMTK